MYLLLFNKLVAEFIKSAKKKNKKTVENVKLICNYQALEYNLNKNLESLADFFSFHYYFLL